MYPAILIAALAAFALTVFGLPYILGAPPWAALMFGLAMCVWLTRAARR